MASLDPRVMWQQAKYFLEEAFGLERYFVNQKERTAMCNQSKQTIIQFLRSYLIRNGIEPNPVETIYILTEQCKDIDPRFYNLDLHLMNCQYEMNTTDFCGDPDQLTNCLSLAKIIEELTAIDPLPDSSNSLSQH